MTRIQDLMDQRAELLSRDSEGMSAEEVRELTGKIRDINAKIEFEKMKESKPVMPVSAQAEEVKPREAFAGYVKGKRSREIVDAMVESEDTKGGYIVPDEIDTAIREFQRNFFDIRPYISVENVTSDSGAITVVTNEPKATGFASIDEAAEIQEAHTPEFGRLTYQVHKYAGFIPITNELIADSTDNIVTFVTQWMGKMENNTANYQVFHGAGGQSAVPGILSAMAEGGALADKVTSLDTAPKINAFKKIINVQLSDIPKANRKLFTTPTGYNYLDNLTDSNGHPYIQPDVTKASGASFLGIEIVQVPEKFMGLDEEYTPFIIGDLAQLYTLYQRQGFAVESTNVGGNAWRRDETELRAIFRFGGALIDTDVVRILKVANSALEG